MASQTTTRESAAVNTVARETLRRIAQEHISPTPETYARIYREIAATHPDHPSSETPDTSGPARQTAALITRLVAQVDAHHSGITITRKREGLKRALIPRAEPVESLVSRLNRLMDSWNGPNAETGANVSQFLGTDILGASQMGVDLAIPAPTLGQTVPSGQHLHRVQAPAASMRGTTGVSDLSERVISLRLAGLLALLLKNIGDLTPESGALSQQIEQIGRVLTAPLTEKKLDEAERCLRALIMRQGVIKQSLDDTKRAMRELAGTLLERLQTLVTSTDMYSTQVFEMSERIATADNFEQLSELTQMLVSDSRLMSNNFAAERTMLLEARARVSALQARTASLEKELREATVLVRTDPLTGALNRRGFGEAFQASMAQAAAAAAGPLPSLALIDVDNFKRINEEFGHSVGDEVLCSLVKVLQQSSMPGHTVARYGGEEFAVLFPATAAQDAQRAIVTMQQALESSTPTTPTGQPRITFSAGLAQVGGDETLAQVIARTDRALRSAKHSGKNCIVIAPFAESRVV